MAVFHHPGGSRSRFGARRRYQPIAEINVTPLVDVMLVLLIVFMVTAPLLTVGVPVDLPKQDAQVINQPDEPLVVSIRSDGQLYLQETAIDIAALVPRLIAITQNKTDTNIFLRGDQSIVYGRVMEVMGALTQAGFTKVALITELPTQSDDQGAKKGN